MSDFLTENRLLHLPMEGGLSGIHRKLMRIGTIGDGSCFFHSICLALDQHDLWIGSYVDSSKEKRQEIAHELRRVLSEAVTEEELDTIFAEATNSLTKPTLDAFKKKLKNSKTWADEPIIRYTSKKLNKNIIFLNLSSNSMFCNVHHPDILKNIHCKTCEALETIVVAWVKHQHFELIGILEKIDSKNIYIEPLIKDTKLIKAIMDEYFKQCKIKKI